MITKYFVEIIASNKQKLVDLQQLELDLFQPSAKTNTDKKEYSIEGLVTLDEVNKLIQSRYKVLVKKSAPTRTPAIEEKSSFQNWKIIAESILSFKPAIKEEKQTSKKVST